MRLINLKYKLKVDSYLKIAYICTVLVHILDYDDYKQQRIQGPSEEVF